MHDKYGQLRLFIIFCWSEVCIIVLTCFQVRYSNSGDKAPYSSRSWFITFFIDSLSLIYIANYQLLSYYSYCHWHINECDKELWWSFVSTSLALGQSYDCPSASEVIPKDMCKHIYMTSPVPVKQPWMIWINWPNKSTVNLWYNPSKLCVIKHMHISWNIPHACALCGPPLYMSHLRQYAITGLVAGSYAPGGSLIFYIYKGGNWADEESHISQSVVSIFSQKIDHPMWFFHNEK